MGSGVKLKRCCEKVARRYLFKQGKVLPCGLVSNGEIRKEAIIVRPGSRRDEGPGTVERVVRGMDCTPQVRLFTERQFSK